MTAVTYIAGRELSRVYGRDYALHRVDFRFEAGQLALLLGPNGSGKSTLLGLVATLDRASSGQLEFGPGRDAALMARSQRGHIGYVSHESLLYGELTAEENLDFFARLYRLPEPQPRINEALERFGLGGARSRPVRTFSRGMRQRLSFARALLNQPDVLLLDEPLSGLDDAGRAVVWDAVAATRESGAVVVMATHLLEVPTELVDQVVVLRRGKVVYAGPADGDLPALYQRALSRPTRRARIGAS